MLMERRSVVRCSGKRRRVERRRGRGTRKRHSWER